MWFNLKKKVYFRGYLLMISVISYSDQCSRFRDEVRTSMPFLQWYTSHTHSVNNHFDIQTLTTVVSIIKINLDSITLEAHSHCCRSSFPLLLEFLFLKWFIHNLESDLTGWALMLSAVWLSFVSLALFVSLLSKTG